MGRASNSAVCDLMREQEQNVEPVSFSEPEQPLNTEPFSIMSALPETDTTAFSDSTASE